MINQQFQALVVTPINKAVNLNHDGKSFISIQDEPIELPHSSPKTVKKLQDIQMMDFQSKVSALLSLSTANAGLSLPLSTGQYKVEITVQSHRLPAELPLLSVMKSVVDGINKQIIADDQYVYQCDIQYISSKRKIRPSQPKDFLTVVIYDMNSGQEIAGFRSVNIHVVPKSSPHVYDFDNDVYFYPKEDFYYQSVADGLINDGMRIPDYDAYAVSMKFEGSIKSKDLDNMARVYYPILHELGVKEERIYSLSLLKQSSINPCTEISILCK